MPMALVLSVVLGALAVAIATFATQGLRYSRIIEARADRLAAADGGMRWAIEGARLNKQALCMTNAGSGGGYITTFPPQINGAITTITCQRIATPPADVQGWAIVVTGQGVPAGTGLHTSGGNGLIKSFGGPVFVYSPSGVDLGAPVELKDGDLWYTASTCPIPEPVLNIAQLTFSPSFLRGTLCTTFTWQQLFLAPVLPAVPPLLNPAPITLPTGCTVFLPGKYTVAPTLGTENYFASGNYYFENIGRWAIGATVIAGYSDGSMGDAQFLTANKCTNAQNNAAVVAAVANNGPGSTFYLGGNSRIYVDNQGGLEIMRRKQDRGPVSIQAIETTAGGYVRSTVDYASGLNILETKSGNTNDMVIHGLVWAPRASASLGNVTNTANGQLLGGIVSAYLDVQASASVSAFNIRIETNPTFGKVLLIATATKDGHSTKIRVVADVQPDNNFVAVNSWRVE